MNPGREEEAEWEALLLSGGQLSSPRTPGGLSCYRGVRRDTRRWTVRKKMQGTERKIGHFQRECVAGLVSDIVSVLLGTATNKNFPGFKPPFQLVKAVKARRALPHCTVWFVASWEAACKSLIVEACAWQRS